jgi:hypothetical protein
VRSAETKPFRKFSFAGDSLSVAAVDFDLGRQRFAYFDRDSASYHYTPGVNTRGNRGGAYRNDGVDIQRADADNYVFNIEDGEWLQYTLNIPRTGKYFIGFEVAAANDSSVISFQSGSTILISELKINSTGDLKNWKTIGARNIQLEKGVHQFRVYANKGGFNFRRIYFTKEK